MSVPGSGGGGSGTLLRGKPNEMGIGSSVPLCGKPLISRPSAAPTGGTIVQNASRATLYARQRLSTNKNILGTESNVRVERGVTFDFSLF